MCNLVHSQSRARVEGRCVLPVLQYREHRFPTLGEIKEENVMTLLSHQYMLDTKQKGESHGAQRNITREIHVSAGQFQVDKTRSFYCTPRSKYSVVYVINKAYSKVQNGKHHSQSSNTGHALRTLVIGYRI